MVDRSFRDALVAFDLEGRSNGLVGERLLVDAGSFTSVLRAARHEFLHRAVDGFLEGPIVKNQLPNRAFSDWRFPSSPASGRELFGEVDVCTDEPGSSGLGGRTR